MTVITRKKIMMISRLASSNFRNAGILQANRKNCYTENRLIKGRSSFVALVGLLSCFCMPVLAQTSQLNSNSQLNQESSSASNSAKAIAISKVETQTTSSASEKAEKEKKRKCYTQAASPEWIDRFRSGTHERLCRTVMWVDSRFGQEHDFQDEKFRGKVAIGFRDDEKEGFDPRLRVRIKARLPNVSERLNAFIGRVDEDGYVSNTESRQQNITNSNLRSNNLDEDDWLIGLGYRNPNKSGDGFDLSVGAKLSSGLSPYAKIAYRHLIQPSDNHYWRTTQTAFWRKKDGFGVSSNLDYTYLINDKNIFEWDTSVKHTEEKSDWEWYSGVVWHHSFTDKRGLSSRLYMRGEKENPVSLPEYGVSFTYIRPFLRPWLYFETGIDYRWEKELPDQEYEGALRVGFQVQMILGDYYQYLRRKVKR